MTTTIQPEELDAGIPGPDHNENEPSVEPTGALPDPLDADAPEEADEINPTDHAEALVLADRHLQAISELEAKQAELNAVYSRRIDEMVMRRDEELAKLERAIQWHVGPVYALHLALLRDDPKRKSIVLPSGTLKARSVAPTVQLTPADMDKIVEWVKSTHPEAVKVTEKVNVTDLRPFVEIKGDKVLEVETGEVVPGAFIKPASIEWKMETA